MIIYNNNIITSGAYWNDEYADSWCHEDCYATGGIVPTIDRRRVREGNWVVVDILQSISVPATGGSYTYNLGVTAPFYTVTNNSWLVGTARIYSRNGAMLVSRGSAVTASDLLESASLGEDGGIVGAHYEVVKYFPIRVTLTVPRNTGAERYGQIRFRNERGDLSVYHLATGNVYTTFSINVNQLAASTTSNYGNLRFTINPMFSTSVGGYYIFTLYVGSNDYSIDTRTMFSPYMINNIPTGTYSLSASGRYYGDGTYKELTFSFSPSSVTISKNGTATTTITVREA